MWTLVYRHDYGDHKLGDLHLIGRGPFDPSIHNMSVLEYVDIPEQDVSHLYYEAGVLCGMLTDLKQYTSEEKAALIDRDTGKVIDETIHPFAGVEEQIGILRDQLVHIINDLGLTPTADFEQLNSIAVAKIEEGAKKKEALNNA